MLPFRNVNFNLEIDDGSGYATVGCVVGSDFNFEYEGAPENIYGNREKSHSVSAKRINFTLTRWYYSNSGREDLLLDLFNSETTFTLRGFVTDKDENEVEDAEFTVTNCLIYDWKPVSGSAEDILGEQVLVCSANWAFGRQWLISDDFEDWNSEGWNITQSYGSVTAPSAEAKYSGDSGVKFVLPRRLSTRYCQIYKSIDANKDVYLSIWFKVPSATPPQINITHFAQFRTSGGILLGSVSLHRPTYNHHIRVSDENGYNYTNLDVTVTMNTWHELLVRFKAINDATGKWVVSLDGVELLDYTGQTTSVAYDIEKIYVGLRDLGSEAISLYIDDVYVNEKEI